MWKILVWIYILNTSYVWGAGFKVIDVGLSTFGLEMAETAAERQMGLMHRTHLAERMGMLFIFPSGEPVRMWMKNTYIPLDMVFIRPDGRIGCIFENRKPHSLKIITCTPPVQAVIEINAGEAKKNHWVEGTPLLAFVK
jgi:uncharacterized membrane protein (UPF0127 family)